MQTKNTSKKCKQKCKNEKQTKILPLFGCETWGRLGLVLLSVVCADSKIKKIITSKNVYNKMFYIC